jgi:hypothetical protein
MHRRCVRLCSRRVGGDVYDDWGEGVGDYGVEHFSLGCGVLGLGQWDGEGKMLVGVRSRWSGIVASEMKNTVMDES